MNANNTDLIKVITKNTFTPDYEFDRKFTIDKKLGGYILWRKRSVQP
jgi:hypothetical protein